jgi:hypothetical protein
MLNKEPLESRLRRYLTERDVERPPIGLEVRIVRKVKEEPTIAAAPWWPRQLLAVAALAALVLGLAGGIAYLRNRVAPTPARQTEPTPNPQTGLTPAEQAELAILEARPLNLPPMPANGQCPDGPHSNVKPYPNTSVDLYGSGPVYGRGGPETDSANARYYDLAATTDPTVRDVVLIRGKELGGNLQIFWVGPYSAGRVVGTDSVGGRSVDLHAEAVLPVARPPVSTGTAPGWTIWPLRDGIANGYNGCAGFQIDTPSSTEVFVSG